MNAVLKLLKWKLRQINQEITPVEDHVFYEEEEFDLENEGQEEGEEEDEEEGDTTSTTTSNYTPYNPNPHPHPNQVNNLHASYNSFGANGGYGLW